MLTIVLIPVSLALGGLLYITVKIYLEKRKYSHIPGPSTNGILGFYMGNATELLQSKKGEIIPDVLVKWVKQYGPTFKYEILGTVKVFTIEPDALKDIFITNNFPKDPKFYTRFGFPFDVRFMGKGLLTDFDDTRWKHRRALYNPGFHRQVLNSFLSDFNSKSDILMEHLRKLADGKTRVTMLDELNSATLDVISSVAFGMQTDSINDPENKLNDLVLKSFNGFTRATADPLLKLKPHKWSYITDYKKTVDQLRELGRVEIRNRIKTIQEGGYVPNDLLTILLKNSTDEVFELEDLVDDFVTFFVAGQETTANTLSFSLLELGRHPEVLEKARQEIDKVVGSSNEVNFNHLPELTYINAIVKETLRIWSTVPAMVRLVTKPLKIGEYDIPEGTSVSTSAYVSARYEKFYENPLEFKPERFLEGGNIINYTYFPFSLGPRNCIGQNFAHIESKVILAKFLQNFEFKLDPNQSYGPKLASTIAPASGTQVYLRLRNN